MASEKLVRRRVKERSEASERTFVSGAVRSAAAVNRREFSRAAQGSASRRAARDTARRRMERESAKSVERNRAKQTGIGRFYVVFLALMSVLTVMMCVYYLRLKAQITALASTNEALATQLETIKSENDALYENVNNDVDWARIRDVAMNELGMKYAAEDQIVWYNTEDSSYVRQYGDVPSG